MANTSEYNSGSNDKYFTRPDDITLGGQHLSEIVKSEGQKAVLALSKKLLLERLESLGIHGRKIDESRVTYAVPVNMNHYRSDVDFVFLRESSEANVAIAVHELTHYAAARWQFDDHQSVLADKRKTRREVKSGFHANWYKNGFDQDSTSGATGSLRNFNEAVTEKIARELVALNHDEVKRMSGLFAGRCEEMIAKFEKEFEQKKQKAFESINDLRAKTEREVQEAILEEEQRLKELEVECRENKVDEAQIANYLNLRRESFAKWIEETRKLYAFEEDIILMGSRDEDRVSGITEIRKEYNQEDTSDYGWYVKILDLMIEGAAYAESDSVQEFEANKEKIWGNLQRAYFKGNSMYLRKFDRAYGEKILRRFEQLCEFTDHNKKETKALIAYLERRNAELKWFSFGVH